MEEARFQWWVQKTFNVLPTDSRFTDLTEEQLDLMFQHYLLDAKPVKTKKSAEDPDYEEPEHYDDPDFEAEWKKAEDEDQDSHLLSEKRFSEEGQEETIPQNPDTNFDDYEEV